MPKTDAAEQPFRSKIAGIQEHSNFPAVENGLPAADIDLPTRDGFARHTLVGLNIFLIDMAKQFGSEWWTTMTDGAELVGTEEAEGKKC